MILYIKGADFSSANIGTLNSYMVRKSIGQGATHRIPDSVIKNSVVNWEITLNEGYTFGSYTITMGSTTITPTVNGNGNVMTISIPKVTGNINVSVATINENVNEELYTFTITPSPGNATVKLTAIGYTQVGNSIAVAAGTNVIWEVSADGYTTQSGTETINDDLNKSVTLVGMDGGTLTCMVNNNINGNGEEVTSKGRCFFAEYIPNNGKKPTASFTNSSLTPTIAYRYYDSDKNFIGWTDTYVSASSYVRVCLLFTEGEQIDPLTLQGETITINNKTYAIDCLISESEIKVKYQLNKNIGADGIISDTGGGNRIALEHYFETNGENLLLSHNIENVTTTAIRYYKDKDVINNPYSSSSGSLYGRIVFVIDSGVTLNDEFIEGKEITVNNIVYTITNL